VRIHQWRVNLFLWPFFGDFCIWSAGIFLHQIWILSSLSWSVWLASHAESFTRLFVFDFCKSAFPVLALHVHFLCSCNFSFKKKGENLGGGWILDFAKRGLSTDISGNKDSITPQINKVIVSNSSWMHHYVHLTKCSIWIYYAILLIVSVELRLVRLKSPISLIEGNVCPESKSIYFVG